MGISANLVAQAVPGAKPSIGLNLDNERIRATITVWDNGPVEIIALNASNGETAFLEESAVLSEANLNASLESWVAMVGNY